MKLVMTLNLFIAIKTLREGGAQIKEIANFLKVSPTTINRVLKAETLEEYFNQCAVERKASYAKKKEKETAPEKKPEPAPEPAQVIEKRTTVTVQASHFMECELRKQTEVLELISRKLTATMEAVNELLGVWKNS